MREETLYFHQEQYHLNEARTSNVNRIMIVPYSYPRNSQMLDAIPGDTIVFKDNRRFILEASFILSTSSPAFNGISMLIFGIPARELLTKWKEQYKDDIQYDTALIIIYSNDKTQTISGKAYK